MAVEISKSIQDDYRFPNFLYLRLLIFIRPVRKKIHELLRKQDKSKSIIDVGICNVTKNFEKSKKKFNEDDWCFIEGFFDDSFYKHVLNNWPKFYYFEPVKKLLKSYDMGLNANKSSKNEVLFNLNPVIKTAFEYLASEGFENRVTEFCDDNVNRSLYSYLLTQSHCGTSVIPHRDSIALEKEGKYFINIVYFLDGKSGANNGGLCILGDNTFDEVIFKPGNLKNTALIYRSNAKLYHGFERIKFNAKRRTINIQYCPSDYASDSG